MQHRNSSIPAGSPAPWLEVSEATPGRFRLRLGGGGFSLGFLPSLCCGLSADRIGIERGHAVRFGLGDGGPYVWNAELYICPMDAGADPRRLSLIELASRPAPSPVDGFEVKLQDIQVGVSDAYGGSLYLQVRGQDRVGLLGQLLSRIDATGLEPVELHVETRGSRIDNSFWFHGYQHAAARGDLDAVLHLGDYIYE